MFRYLKAKLFPPIVKLYFNDGRVRFAPLTLTHDTYTAGGHILLDDNKVQDPNDLVTRWEYVKQDDPPPRKPRQAPRTRIRQDITETVLILRTQVPPTLTNPTSATDLADRLERYAVTLKG